MSETGVKGDLTFNIKFLLSSLKMRKYDIAGNKGNIGNNGYPSKINLVFYIGIIINAVNIC